MPVTNDPNWINWKTSAAREIILEDLEPGGILYQEDHVPAEIAWEIYKLYPEFTNVVYSQFEKRLATHREKATERFIVSRQEERMLEHDRRLHPEELYSHRGEAVFPRFPAAELLKQDVEAGLHETMSVAALHSSRDEYDIVKLPVFAKRIKQAVRLQKFTNYMEMKRTEKRTEFFEKQKKKAEKAKKKAEKEAMKKASAKK